MFMFWHSRQEDKMSLNRVTSSGSRIRPGLNFIASVLALISRPPCIRTRAHKCQATGHARDYILEGIAHIVWILSMELASCHHSGISKLRVATRFRKFCAVLHKISSDEVLNPGRYAYLNGKRENCWKLRLQLTVPNTETHTCHIRQ